MRQQRTQVISFYKAEASQRGDQDVTDAIEGANRIFAQASVTIEQEGTLGTIQIKDNVIKPDDVETICGLVRSPGISAIFVPAIQLGKGFVTNGLSSHNSRAFLVADALGADGAGILTRGDKFIRAFSHELAHCLRRDDVEYKERAAKGKLLLYWTTDNGTELTRDDIDKINPESRR